MLDLPDVAIGAGPRAPAEPEHSPMGPSTFERIWNCPGSVRLNAELTGSESVWAWDGTCAHALLEHCLREADYSADGYIGCKLEAKGREFIVNAEHVHGANKALKLVESLRTPGDTLFIEQRLDLSRIFPGVFGTADVVLLTTDGHMHVIDYKHGAGVVVEVENNKQTMGYALGALYKFGRKHRTTAVTCWIVQPRVQHDDGPVRSVSFAASDLFDWSSELRAALAETTNPAAKICAGKWCKFCPAAEAQTCEAFRTRAVAAASSAFGVITTPEEVKALDMAELGRRLQEAELIAAYLSALKAYVDESTSRGLVPDGYELVGGYGRLQWNTNDAALLAQKMLAATGVDIDQTEPAVMTVGQFKKLHPEVFERVKNDFLEWKEFRHRLCRKDDKRPKPQRSDALNAYAKAFSVITTQ